jgi:hypothetical protein
MFSLHSYLTCFFPILLGKENKNIIRYGYIGGDPG